MSGKGWLLIHEAAYLIVERHLGDSANYQSALDYVWKDILADMGAALLPSRTNEPGSFIYRLITDQGTEVIPLDRDGAIPGHFWLHFMEAFEKRRSALVTLDGQTYAGMGNGKFHFRLCERIRNGGVLEGQVADVEVFRSHLPMKLPNPRGNKEGRGRHVSADKILVEQMRHHMASTGETSPYRTSLVFVDRAKGTADISNRAKRLENKLKASLKDRPLKG